MALPDYRLRYNRAAFFNFASHALRLKVSSLVKAGFYYTQNEDMVHCYNCKITISNWRQNSRPFELHKRKSPRCSVVKDHVLQRPSKLLLLMSPHSKLLAAHYFQAVYRLQQYLSFSESNLNDQQMDEQPKISWTSNKRIQRVYCSIRQQLLRSKTTLKISTEHPISAADSALGWFQKVSRKQCYDTHTKKPDKSVNMKITSRWLTLPNYQRQHFTDLAAVDRKGAAAEKIERHCNKLGLTIGSDFYNSNNITMSLLKGDTANWTISTKLRSLLSHMMRTRS